MRSGFTPLPLVPAVDAVRIDVEEWIRKLLELTERNNNGPANMRTDGIGTDQTLLDIEVDGSRYLLLRMPKPNDSRLRLSPREQEIVRMVADGHPNKVIADVLNISAWTVCTHLRRIFAKLGVGSRAAMVAQLLEVGALSSEHCKRPR
jgi:DNA-binding CsgD family transcriptional regulator